MSPKANIVLDATQLDTYIVCPAKFDFRFNQNKTPPTTAAPLDRGALIHLCKEVYYNNLKEHKPWDYCVNEALVATRFAGTQSDLEAEEVSRILEVLEENLTYWRIADMSYEIKAVEQPFAYVLYEDELIRVMMIGKMDLVFSDNKYTNCPMDSKSYERDFSTSARRLTNQFCNYATAMNSNILFMDRIGMQKTVPVEKKHKRVPLSYDPLILQQWKENVVKWCYSYYDSVTDNSWPMNLTSCDKYNRLCEYYEICDSSGVAAKEYKLNVNFATSKKWDPSDVLRKTSDSLIEVGK